MGSVAQASVPGAYAWAATVAPAAWAHGSGTLAKVAALLALIALAAGWAAERRWGGRFRLATLWGFVLASALTWSAAPMALAPLRFDAVHGLAGMLGWALFALALAAPSLDPVSQSSLMLDAEPLVARRRLATRDTPYLVGAAAIAVSMQLVGWRVAGAERALLVRFVAVAAGLAVIDAAVTIALARHTRRIPRGRRIRFRAAMVPFVLLGILVLTGLLFVLRG
ncbi:MAG: hypothetical protein ACLP1X_12730 [Polyangiaceae bacterium]